MFNKNNKLSDESLLNISGGIGAYGASTSAIDSKLNQVMNFINQIGGESPTAEKIANLTPQSKTILKKHLDDLQTISNQMAYDNQPINQRTLRKIKDIIVILNKYIG